MLTHVLALTLALQHPFQHSPPQQDGLVPADSAFKLMKNGGYTMIWRHAETDYSKSDVPGSNDRAQQRNLSPRGETDAKAIGAMFQKLGVRFGEVRSSQLWRTRETARLAFGNDRVTVDTLLRTLQPTREQKQLIATRPARGTNRVLVTHHFVIEQNVKGIRPGMIGEGEAVVLQPVGGDDFQLLSIIKLKDWEKATAGAVVADRPRQPGAPVPAGSVLGGLTETFNPSTLAIMHKPEYVNVMNYLMAFNQGEAEMKKFVEERWVPSAERTTEQRLETYRTLKGHFGSVAPMSAEVRGDSLAMAVQVMGGQTAVLTFLFEKKEPYRLVSLSFARFQK
jgi:phosphohistidine phosphatase SixA